MEDFNRISLGEKTRTLRIVTACTPDTSAGSGTKGIPEKGTTSNEKPKESSTGTKRIRNLWKIVKCVEAFLRKREGKSTNPK